jgi:hypothetical protein
LSRFFYLLLFGVVLQAAVVTPASAVDRKAEVWPVTGPRFVANLTASQGGVLTFTGAEGERRLALADLAFWGSPVNPVPNPQYPSSLLLLANGDLLVADVREGDQEFLHIDTPGGSPDSPNRSPKFGPRKIPLELVAGLVFHMPVDPQRRDQLIGRLKAASAAPAKGDERAGQSDRLILENGDELPGQVTNISEKAVELKSDVGAVSIERTKIAAIVFNPSLLARFAPYGPRILVGLRDGSRLTVSSLIYDGKQIRLTLPDGSAGLVWKTSEPTETDRIGEVLTFVQPLNIAGGKITYLSDLTAASYVHVPFLSLSWPYRTDANVVGTQLRAGGRLYAKGIGMHSTSRLTYRIDAKPYKRFEAALAVDDHTEGRGSVVFRVYVDSQERYHSPAIRGQAGVIPISVDVQGGKQLSLIVDYAEGGDELDHADWLNARLVE